MSEDFVEILTQRLNELKEEISTLQENIQELFSQVGMKQEQAQHIIEILASEDYAIEDEDLAKLGNVQVADVAYDHLDRDPSKSPIHYRELTSALQAKGLFIPGKDAAANLLTQISRDTRFVRVAPGTYGLKKWNLTPDPKRRRKKRKIS